MQKISLITLGCPKNIVESESIAGILKNNGYLITTDIPKADVVLVHTCSFIQDAKNESEEVIRSLIELKEKQLVKKIIVSGCLVQELGKKIKNYFRNVDSFVGTGELDKILKAVKFSNKDYINHAGGLLETSYQRELSSKLPSTYLRIAEGCNHKCSFCIIPKLRGKYKSREINSIFKEAKHFVQKGIKELNLIAQDTTYYGRDLKENSNLKKLLTKITKLNGLKWLRILYANPDSISEDLLKLINENSKICNYLDIPIQHVSDRILNQMGRKTGVREVIEKICRKYPGITLRTTIIVGFPGETDKDFRELCDFISKGLFEHLGVFEYSASEGAKSARFKNKVSEKIKRRRMRKIMYLQKEIVKKRNKRKIGSLIDVFVEKKLYNNNNKEFWLGRAQYQAPEIDSNIIFSGTSKVGNFEKVSIVGYKDYDLIGEIL